MLKAILCVEGCRRAGVEGDMPQEVTEGGSSIPDKANSSI
jgi:hypothetical protein